jgi:chemotaxis protein methyltransferase CheR
VALEPDIFERFAAAVKAASGLIVPRDQAPFVEARLQPAVRRLELASVEVFVERILAGHDPDLIQAAVEALAVTETCFFRDKTPFETLQREVLPALTAARGDRPLQVWSAGCSTGQEAYSLALLSQLAPGAIPARLDILGSDLSERCLEKAASGLYTQFEVQKGLPIRLLLDGFEPVDEMWRVAPRLRQAVRWERRNLMEPPTGLGPFDLILCRNVLPAFDRDTARQVLEQLASVLAPDGRLLLGLSETVHGVTDIFRPIAGRRGLYARDRDPLRQIA